MNAAPMSRKGVGNQLPCAIVAADRDRCRGCQQQQDRDDQCDPRSSREGSVATPERDFSTLPSSVE
jgi:hypothetical protein